MLQMPLECWLLEISTIHSKGLSVEEWIEDLYKEMIRFAKAAKDDIREYRQAQN